MDTPTKPRYRRAAGTVLVLQRDQATRARLAVRHDQLEACRQFTVETVPEASVDSAEQTLLKLAHAVAKATGSDTITHNGTLLDLEAAMEGLAIPVNKDQPPAPGHLLDTEFKKLGLGIEVNPGEGEASE